MYNF